MATTPYLTLEQFKKRTTVPRAVVDGIERDEPDWTLTQLQTQTSYINARLSKRYDVPFASSVPDIVLGWLTALVALDCFVRRGVDPEDRQWDAVEKAAERAREELTQAADAIGEAGTGPNVRGMFDLPLRAETPNASGVVKGGPYSYSEQSPYVGLSLQRSVGRNEDASGSGTGG